ncbi:MAG: hypothetical protein JSW26_15515 [Desulfobacterales bacterium]|nr:MAG: hypothetical protein JSW26_15515 [Desulfobacterales bacterium]
MKPPIVIIGIGELGGVFAKAFLRSGHPVYPVTRAMSMNEAADHLPAPELVLVAVAEKDFQTVMETLPDPWRNNPVLLQNELLPRDWLTHHVKNPTVISVWFEKKKGMDYHVLLPSPVFGPKAQLIAESLARIQIPGKILADEDELVFELVLKNVFVFTINIAGLILEEGTTTSTLWEKHQKLARDVANEIIDIQQFLTGASFVRDRLIEGFIAGVKGDPAHKCKGRAARGRLIRMVQLADDENIKIQTIRDIHRRLLE